MIQWMNCLKLEKDIEMMNQNKGMITVTLDLRHP